MADLLESWNDGATKAAITDFVARVSEEGGPDYVEPFLMVAVPKAFEAVTVEDYDRRVKEFFGDADNAGLKRPYRDCGYQPMVELLRYLETNGFATYIASGAMDFFDDGPEKPVRIWSRIGRRPILAFGNSNGDVPMLAFSGTPSTPSLRLLLLHDDADREFDYTAGAEQALETASRQNWTVVSMKNDWNTVFTGTA